MKFRNVISFSAIAALGLTAAMLTLSSNVAHAVTAEQLVGTWRLVSTTNTDAKGAKIEPFGAHPSGSYTFDASGHFTQVILPSAGGGKEYVAAFGDYSLTDGGKTLVRHMIATQNPTANGKDRPVTITLANDELKISNSSPTIGTEHAEAVWKRVK